MKTKRKGRIREKSNLGASSLKALTGGILKHFGSSGVEALDILLEVYLDPGKTQQHYIDNLREYSRATVQRYFNILGDRGFRNHEGMGLISSEVSPTYWRERLYQPTIKGAAVVRDLQRHMDHYADAR